MTISFTGIKRAVISVLVAAYLLVSINAGLPFSALTVSWGKCLRPIFHTFGLYNNFGVFAPDPVTYNQEFRAVIHFKDGSSATWKFPSLLDWQGNDVMKQLKLPWVEWEYYIAYNTQNDVLVPDAAKYLAYQFRNPKNQPITIDIYRDYNNIVVPGDNEHSAKMVSDLLLKYHVEDEDLH